MPRSRSSPSPPASVRRGDTTVRRQNARLARKAPAPIVSVTAGSPVMDWSTSYQAGSSSSAGSEESSADDTEDEDRGRASQATSRSKQSSSLRPPSLHRIPRESSDDKIHDKFTRSRSPAIPKNSLPSSPSVSRFSARHKISTSRSWSLLPSLIQLHARLPFTGSVWAFSIDTRRAGESLLVLASFTYATLKLLEMSDRLPQLSDRNLQVPNEMYFLGISSLLYVLWTHNSITNVASQASKSLSMKPLQRPASPRIMEARDRRPPVTLVPDKTDFSFIWMSVPKNYRESADDGIVTGLLFGPIIASALLYSSLSQQHSLLPDTWRIESPSVIMNTKRPFTAIEALILSRFNLLDLSTLCSTILLFHTCASWWLESRYRDLNGDGPDGERRSVPRKEGQRSWYYIMFTVSVSLSLVAIKFVLQRENILVWQHLNLLEVAIVLLFYQFTLYVAIRLAHRGFTLGELSLVGFGGTALFMELLNLTMAKIWPVTTPFIKTYRIPNPLLIFQTALIAGSFLTGFLLAPFLVLSRHIAQRPVRRLKYPEQKLRYRRLLALGFYVGAVLVIGGLIGMWTRWCLGRRDPWLWTIFWLLEGRKRWSRSALLIYWAALGSLSIAGWNRQLARSRRYRSLAENAANSDTGESGPSQAATLNLSVPPAVPASSANSLGLNFPNLPNLPNGADLWDVADRHVPTLPTLRLNARRKFFHALAVAMFVPGVALDPAFTHLSFSVAFALFTFAEYVRYFAIYPFGASIHLFLNEFLDHRDGGTAILSHFYLLTGCAGSVWLETSSRLFQFTGILVLGVGDALASIVGKRYGIHSWSPTTSKTLEGSVAFTLSIVACASLLRLCGFVDPFSTLTYLTVVGISSVLEALSDQNDNLTLPLYLWSMLVLVNV